MHPGETITYLRKGRVKRASGRIVSTGPKGTVKVKPEHPSWKLVWLTGSEIAAGKEKPPIVPRPKPGATEKPKRKRSPKPPAPPRWKQLVEQARDRAEKEQRIFGILSADSQLITELADELEAARGLFHNTP